MKKLLIFIAIIVIGLIVWLNYADRNRESVESPIPYENRDTAPEAYNQSFRKTESSIPPPSVMETMPPEEGEEI